MSRRRRRNASSAGHGPGVETPLPAGVENVAPITAGSGPLHTSADALKYLRQNKHNPLPYLKPDMLSRALEAFEHGRIREAVLLWEKMAERDDMLSNVKPKREKDVSQLDMQVVVEEDSGPDGQAHQAVLQKFWKSCRAVNAYDRNERGGFRRLVKQMMTAVSYRYAAHHIIWEPKANGELRATFEFVPLWLFENTTGKLRYLANMTSLSGEMLDDSEWMVTTGDGLMISCSIGYLAKRAAFNDWLIFSEKFSVPGVLGRTSAAAGTPEANAMAAATQAFGHDWCAVITGDDGTHAEPIKIIQAAGNPSGMPMPAVIEAVNRRMASVYRGADLSSMSSGPSGEGSGASLQEKETDILRRDDAETIAETLAEVSRMVIEWHFGNGVEPLARVELIVPVQEDATSVVNAATQLADRGAKVSASSLMDRLNIPVAKDAADALGAVKAETLKTETLKEELANAAEMEDPEPEDGRLDDEMQALRMALAEDLRPLGDALFSAYQAGDMAAMSAALKKISKDMPELAGDASTLSAVISSRLADAFLGDETEEVENSGTPGGAVKGWETRRRNGWQSQPKAANQDVSALVDDALDNTSDNTDRIAFYADVGTEEARLLGLPPGYKRGLSRHGVRHMWKSHSNPQTEMPKGQVAITRDDLRRIPEIIAKSQEAAHSGENNNVQTIRYYFDDPQGGTTTVLDEVRGKWKRLIPMQLMKFKKSGMRRPLAPTNKKGRGDATSG